MFLATCWSGVGRAGARKPEEIKLQWTIQAPNATHYLWTVAVSNDGNWLAFGSSDMLVWLYSLKGDGPPVIEHILADSEDSVHAVAFSFGSKWLATACRDGVTRVYSISDLGNLEDDERPKATYVMDDAKNWLWAVAFSSDDYWLATGGGDRTLRLYRMMEDEEPLLRHTIVQSDMHACWIMSIVFSSDRRWLATGGWDSQARIYKLRGEREPELMYTLTDAESPLCSVAFSYNTRWFATGGWDNNTRLYYFSGDGEPELRHNLTRATNWIRSLSFSSDDRWLAAGSRDDKVRVYSFGDDKEPKLQFTLREAECSVMSVAFSYDGRWLATASFDNLVRLYQLRADAVREIALQDTANCLCLVMVACYIAFRIHVEERWAFWKHFPQLRARRTGDLTRFVPL